MVGRQEERGRISQSLSITHFEEE